MPVCTFSFFFFNDTATTEIYTLSLHDALPILIAGRVGMTFGSIATALPLVREGRLRAFGVTSRERVASAPEIPTFAEQGLPDRKSTRLNSSHANISYAVFCLKKKKKRLITQVF